jgi:hypothetical protein
MIKIHRENTVNQMDKLSTLEKATRIELLTIRGFEHNLESNGIATIPSTKNIEKYLDQLVRIHESGRKLLESLKSN